VLTNRGVVAMPAMAVLGFWIVIQVVSQMSESSGPAGGGVAYMAHIAGFVAGIALVHLFGTAPSRRSALVRG
jgi:membrane associated rhomboid family serine protease